MPGDRTVHTDRESRRLPWPTLFQFSSSYESFSVHTMVSIVEAIIIVFSLSPFFSPNFACAITSFVYWVLFSKVSFVTDWIHFPFIPSHYFVLLCLFLSFYLLQILLRFIDFWIFNYDVSTHCYLTKLDMCRWSWVVTRDGIEWWG
jgi:hypothetical protein